MKKLVRLLFGSPFKKEDNFRSKYFRFMYKFIIGFYFLSMTMFIILSFLDPTALIGLLMGAIFFPVVFRIVYGLIGKFNGMEREA
ncbi:hypothetical protein M3181_19315 [Mesobacillus maritimus]|uniref:hypothetical protein n=1 Tax=Mesobacillus maritimus TaxID=1643336 RepID=UPI00203D7166|nr:hypothetical protein [Mesobacillus maritimus]MCM3671113.1 hypothetical protein [Mesobacillus maritimus]